MFRWLLKSLLGGEPRQQEPIAVWPVPCGKCRNCETRATYRAEVLDPTTIPSNLAPWRHFQEDVKTEMGVCLKTEVGVRDVLFVNWNTVFGLCGLLAPDGS